MDLSIIPLVLHQGTDTNYRIKICVNFIQNDVHITTYSDTITNLYLLEKINRFIRLLIQLNNQNIVYGTFQKSNHMNNYGVIIALNKQINITEFYDKIKEIDLTIFGYYVLPDKTITYLTVNNRLQNYYYNFIWYISLNSFVQINPYTGQNIHQIIDKLINKNNFNYYGLGGEMGVYLKRNLTIFRYYICLTNSQTIYDDYLINLSNKNIYLVDYDNINLKSFVTTENNNILLVNISRNGLKNIASQINKIKFDQIIYIGCCDIAVNQDIKELNNYKINQIFKLNQFPQTKYFIYIIDFTHLE